MKRLLPALTIGVVVSAVVLTLHISGAALRPELALSDWLARGETDARLVSDKVQFPLVFLIAAAAAWAFLETKRRERMAIVIGALALELLAVAWVFGLYHTFFQPLPGMAAALLSLGGSLAFVRARDWWRNRPVREAPVKTELPILDLEPMPPLPVRAPLAPPIPAPLPPPRAVPT